MNTNTRILLIVGGLLILILALFLIVRSNEPDEVAVPEPTSFEECASRYPVMESYPRRCVSPSGQQFVEQVAQPVAPTTTPTQPAPQQPSNPGIPNLITITSPRNDQRITSPLTISGEARGTWYFEASFPVEIRDAFGRIIAQGPAQAQGEWMTENFVPFRTTLSYPAQPAGSEGVVILRKDNPSGDPARDQSVTIPVRF